uniref:Ig-like domain-containing protein n=1 Tax=Amphilophus citrinellus TaxID=61819 RepID=A0A3Q0S5G2_AMPCI
GVPSPAQERVLAPSGGVQVSRGLVHDYKFQYVYMFVSVPPSIKGGNVTTEVTALLDTVVTLECEARGVPLPTITWYRKGEVILSSRQAQYVEQGHYLKIPRAQASDAGQYICKVTSVAGSAEKSYTLDVYLPPTIAGGDKGPIKRKVVLSKSLMLECEAGGHPPPSLTWLKDGIPVHDGASVRVLEQGKKLEILSAAVSDSGHYTCVATSIAGEKEVKYDIRVLGINMQNIAVFMFINTCMNLCITLC